MAFLRLRDGELLPSALLSCFFFNPPECILFFQSENGLLFRLLGLLRDPAEGSCKMFGAARLVRFSRAEYEMLADSKYPFFLFPCRSSSFHSAG